MPLQHKRLSIEGQYQHQEFAQIQKGFIPKSPQEKWVILFKQNVLHFFRAQTGTCVYQLFFEPNDQHIAANTIIANRAPKQYRNEDDAFDVAMVAYLIDSKLLGRFSPLPKPKGLRNEDFEKYKKDMLGDDGDQSINLKLI